MSVRNALNRAEQRIRKGAEKALGYETTQQLREVRQEILELLESKIRADKNGNIFPFGKIMVLLQAPTKGLSDAFKTAFLENSSLKADMIRRLEGAKARYSDELEITIDYGNVADPDQTGSDPTSLFQMNFLKPDPIRKNKIPETNLLITKGSAEQPAYWMKKERILVGCLSEVLDREGRLVRRNDVVFLDSGGDINSTVDSIHARIWYDFEKQEFRIMDEVSRYGTRIVRQGRSIEVPAGNTGGIHLRSGDEIHCGQASLRFEVIQTSNSL